MRLVVICLLLPFTGLCSSLRVSNLSLVDGEVGCNVSWEYSWNYQDSLAPANYDAVWIFVKGKAQDGSWEHITLQNSTAIGVDGTSYRAISAKDGRGVLISRAEKGEGKAEATLKLSLAEEDLLDVRVYGIEMVYIQEGSYFLGDSVSNLTLGSSDHSPYQVESEEAITLGDGGLNQLDSTQLIGQLPRSFPKGKEGFYLCKYEISQQQYADFLNTLSFQQQARLSQAPPTSPSGTYALATTAGTNRNNIKITYPSYGGQPASYAVVIDSETSPENAGYSRACNFLNGERLGAYLWWAGLRPYTELEFEKACRGSLLPVPKEFAWGTAIAIDGNTLLADGTEDERVKEEGSPTTGLTSHGYTGAHGPLRTGFAATASTGRVESGAGYYGCFDLSGNLWELIMNISEEGRAFSGNHGSGTLPADGIVSSWPLLGIGYRGGGWNSGVIEGFRDLATSDRFYIYLDPTIVRNTAGGRGALSLSSF